MKLVMDEKLKHRLIGLAVIVSLGAIFAPAIMKKSSQRNESNFSVNVKLPPKPVVPHVTMTDENETFKTIKVARVNVPAVAEDKQLPDLVRAETIKSDQVIGSKGPKETLVAHSVPDNKKEPVKLALAESAKATVDKAITVAATNKSQKDSTTIAVAKPKAAATQIAKAAIKRPIAPKALSYKEVYAVQLASFSQVANAQALVNRLHSKGYKANYIKTISRNGPVYKVYAGHSPNKNDALKMKSQLANALQLNGFVVNTKVS
ncbi:MAG: SPOR domain-containing protein [Legionella sp.]|nr:MAG: SPOR domain-containing protein [Legionella sp.]